MTESKKLSGFNSYISFIGNDRTAHWSHFRNAEFVHYYQENPAVNICCRLMDVTLGTCEQCPVNEAFQTQSYREKELFVNNNQRWLISVQPAFDSQGNFYGVFQTGHDITVQPKPGDRSEGSLYQFHSGKNLNSLLLWMFRGRFYM